MNHLLRELAPISETGWRAIDDDATSRLKSYLAARKVVDFRGPMGWDASSTDLGRAVELANPCEGVSLSQRLVLALVELRAEFEISRGDLDDLERGRRDVSLDDLDRAVRQITLAENLAVFQGLPAAQITGIAQATPHKSVALDRDYAQFPVSVAKALNTLLEAGISGPYGLVVSPDAYTGIIETPEAGDLVLDHLRQILGGPIIWAPGLDGGIVLSLRGGDFVIECGEDLSIGYRSHTAGAVRLYLEESITFQVLEPQAAVVLQG